MKLKNLFISLIAMVILFFTTCCSQSQKSKTTERPNIVWIVCEDMNPILGCYGDNLATTPNLDRLASTKI